MKMIIADDSRVMRSIIERVIRAMGYESLHASNGQEVLELLEKNGKEIGLVLLDWNMPVLDGFEVLKSMQAHSTYGNIPVLMVSTESEDGKAAQAVDAGARGYLPKPFTSDDLTAMIQKTLEKSS
jgi:two-component system chemotaxis response regulator CheY